MDREESLHLFEKKIGHTFNDFNLLKLAMTHTSYANEHKKQHCHHNERLEFLGDAVLELVSSQYLYEKYSDKAEGELTRLRASMVCEPTLAVCGRGFSIDKYILLGKGEENMGGRNRDSIVSDAVEALIGAIYLDGGLNAAMDFVNKFIFNDIENKTIFNDSKTLLQEMVQGSGMGDVRYETISESGPDHCKIFEVSLSVGDRCISTGLGHTKKAAEQQAAFAAIHILSK